MGKPWFHPKRYGYGAGLPCSTEGWSALALFVAAIIGWQAFAAWRFPHGLTAFAGTLVLVVALIVLGRAKTAGGWRWRWGE